MKLSELYKKGDKPVVSIEIFPPKTKAETPSGLNTPNIAAEAELQKKNEELFSELSKLNSILKPALVSVTYGAGGLSRKKTDIIVEEILKKFDYNAVMPHFTCVCSEKKFIEDYLNTLKTFGVENILALKGDEPKDIEVCHRDFQYAYELVDFIKSKTDFEIAVAGYPEGHIDAKSLEEDVKHLKNKVNKGGSVIFTQFFFENDKFYKYLELLEKNGVNVPVIPGLLPVVSYSGLMRMVQLSGIKPSAKVLNTFEKYKDSKEDIIKAGIEQASIQAENLIQNGVLGLHFYTLNKAYSVSKVLKNTYF